MSLQWQNFDLHIAYVEFMQLVLIIMSTFSRPEYIFVLPQLTPITWFSRRPNSSQLRKTTLLQNALASAIKVISRPASAMIAPIHSLQTDSHRYFSLSRPHIRHSFLFFLLAISMYWNRNLSEQLQVDFERAFIRPLLNARTQKRSCANQFPSRRMNPKFRLREGNNNCRHPAFDTKK